MPIRRKPYAAATSILLLLFAASAWADSFDRPVQRRPLRERTSGEGVYGLTMLRIHGGLSAPIGDFSDTHDVGWGLGGSIAHGVTRNLLLSGAVAYHRFENSIFTDQHASITPWTVNLDVVLPTHSTVKPFVGGGVGLYHVSESVEEGGFTVSASENDFGINLGAGVGGPLSPRTLWGVGVKLHQVWGGDLGDSPFFTFQFGFGFAL